MSIGELLYTNLCGDMMAELRTWYGQQLAAPRKRSYTKVTQKHLFSTVLGSLDMLKQSYSGVKTIQQCVDHMNARSHV